MYNRFTVLDIKFNNKGEEYYYAYIKLIDDANKISRNVTLIITEENPTEEDMKNYVNNFVEGEKLKEIKKNRISSTIKNLNGKTIDL